jgi:hypothetical protein
MKIANVLTMAEIFIWVCLKIWNTPICSHFNAHNDAPPPNLVVLPTFCQNYLPHPNPTIIYQLNEPLLMLES